MTTAFRVSGHIADHGRIGRAIAWLGCLAMLGLGPAAPAAAGTDRIPQAFGCSGNEPFWALTVDGEEGTFSRPGADGVAETMLAGGGHGLDYLDPPVFVWRGGPASPEAESAEEAEAEELSGDLVVGIFPQTCRDTMADLPPFSYRAVLSLPDGMAATGCCLAAAAHDILGRAWRVVDIAGTRVQAAEETPQLRFEEGRLTGTSGCNRLFGEMGIDGRSLEVGDLGSTRMMCPAPVMAIEARLLDALRSTASYSLDGTLLVLEDAEGNPLLRLAPMIMPE